MGLPLRPQTLNVAWWYLYFPCCIEGAEDTFSFLLMYCWVLLYCVVFSSFPQKLWQVLCALGVFEWCGVTIIQKILWWCDIPCADTAQAMLCVTREEWPSLSGADIPSVGLCVGLWGRDSLLCWWHSSAAESQGSNSAVRRTRRVCAFCEAVCLDVFDTGARRHIYNCLLT